jgi:hypothetical protein
MLDADSLIPKAAMYLRLILIPSLITLAVTILRLIGELRHWSGKWFSSDTGGTTPYGVAWVVGITWLAALFGAYFAVQLTRAQRKPSSLVKATIFSALGIFIFLSYRYVVEYLAVSLNLRFPHYLIFIWLLWGLAGGLQYFAWPELFKTLLLYAYAARIPVAIIMFFAMLGHWGTHYDYVGMRIPLWGLPRFLWLAFFPQLAGWISFTVTLGSAAGVVVLLLKKLIGLPSRNNLDRIDLGAVN